MKTNWFRSKIILMIFSGLFIHPNIYSQSVNSSTWSATDELGRTLPNFEEVGPIDENKKVGIFYWTWHSGFHAEFEPVMDVTQILSEYPEAANDFDHTAWQGLTNSQFYWSEPLFGYYRTTDPWVLRKHAELLADAGIDVVFFDCTNASITWSESYNELLRVWSEAREDGVNTPQVAFMLPFSATNNALNSIMQIYDDLYSANHYEDLWFQWNKKPLILAYPEIFNNVPTDKAGQMFSAESPFTGIQVSCPSYGDNIGNLTLSLYNWKNNYYTTTGNAPIAQKTFLNFRDNEQLTLPFEGDKAGQKFTATKAFANMKVNVASYDDNIGNLTLSLYNWQGDYSSSVNAEPITKKTFVDFADNSQLTISVEGDRAGQFFTATKPFNSLKVNVASYDDNIGNLTLSLYNWKGDYNSSVNVEPVVQKTFVDFADNAQLEITVNVPAGDYYWEVSEGTQSVGVWSWQEKTEGIQDYLNGEAVSGCYISSIRYAEETSYTNLVSGTIPAVTKIEGGEIPAGNYFWELSDGTQMVGVWGWKENTEGVQNYFNGATVGGGYISRIKYINKDAYTNLVTGSTTTATQISESYPKEKINKVKSFFTFRPVQPDYNTGPIRADQWSWLETYPQHGYAGFESEGFEEASVSVAQNASDASGEHCVAFNSPNTYGRSYTHTNGVDERENSYWYGANFNEQWERAMEIDPQLVFVTGWNEWRMGRFKNWQPCAGPVIENSFVDAFDSERSRDIEPVKSWGNEGDSYYYQLAANIRKFKGMTEMESASGPKSITLGQLDQWSDVKPVYNHYKGNTLHRDHKGQGKQLVYENNTGRNDIVLAKVARDDEKIYFYVETNENLTPQTDENWMYLFIDIDRDKSTGWEGYDFLLNRESPTDKVIVEKSNKGWNWEKIGTADYFVGDKTLEFSVNREMLGLNNSNLDFEFKWSDNMQEKGNIMDFYVNGDVAPGGRFNFVYSTTNGTNMSDIIKNTEGILKISSNPFTDYTQFQIELSSKKKCSLIIYDFTAKRVKTLINNIMSEGVSVVSWNGTDDKGLKLKGGLYLYRFITENGVSKSGKLLFCPE